MRILIIGGTGAAGSRIAAEAQRRGHAITIASRTTGMRVDASDTEAVAAAQDLRATGEGPRWVPPTIRPIAAASTRQLEILQSAGRESAWTYLAPAADFAPAADRTPGLGQGSYRLHLGRDGSVPDLVIAADGTSRISMEDFALAVLDEVEEPRMLRGVIAVGT